MVYSPYGHSRNHGSKLDFFTKRIKGYTFRILSYDLLLLYKIPYNITFNITKIY